MKDEKNVSFVLMPTTCIAFPISNGSDNERALQEPKLQAKSEAKGHLRRGLKGTIRDVLIHPSSFIPHPFPTHRVAEESQCGQALGC